MIHFVRFGAVVALLTCIGVAAADEYSVLEYMSIHRAEKPSWQALGSEFAYLTNISGIPQVWRIASRTGYQHQLTFDTCGVSGCWWSPMDPSVMVIATPAVGGPSRLYRINPQGGQPSLIAGDGVNHCEFGCWAPDGLRLAYVVSSPNRPQIQVSEYLISEAKSVVLFEMTGMCVPVSYSQDNQLVLIERKQSVLDGDLLLYDRASGDIRGLTQHSGNIRFKSPKWDAKAAGFYFMTDQEREFMGLAYWSLDSAQFSWIETPDWDVEEYALSRDGAWLAWVINENGLSSLQVRNLRRNTDTPVQRFPRGVIRDLTFSPDGSQLIYSFASSKRDFDVWVYETYADKLHQATFSAVGGISRESFVEPQNVEYESFDGRKIPALWYTPVGSSQAKPAIVFLSDSPNDQARSDLSSQIQFFVSRGFAVLQPNVRGSSGYGKTYMSLDDGEQRTNSVQDVEYAAKWLASRSEVDAKKLVVFGCGYGGFLAFAALAESPKTWAAGVSVAGVTDLVSFIERAPAVKRTCREAEFGALSGQLEFLAGISPITRASNITSPLLVIEGRKDSRCPGMEGERLIEAVQAGNRSARFVRVDYDGCRPVGIKDRIASCAAVEEFLNEHVLKRKK
ncbi:prolyl oligopeptidase family serine peptidase [bacterium]|nr:prolyl oligopeptidase family serine peptidase [bacterium]MBU1984337.1 prolyl oligopeptidase family serine peptidase [bacterium]